MSIVNRTRVTGFALLAAASITAPVHAAEFLDGRIQTNFMFMQGFQALEADAGAFQPVNVDPATGFQRLRFNAELTVHFNDWITGFIDLGEEPNDFAGPGGDFQISNDLSFIDLSLLKAFNSASAENNSLVLRLGEPVTTMFNYRGFSDGAAVQGNPLIGNSPFDIVTAATGVQLIGEHKLDGPLKSWGWDVSLTVPTFGENFAPDRGYDIFAKGRVDVGSGLKLGVGYMRTDGEDQFTRNAVGGLALDSDLSTTEAVFGDNENYNFPGTGTSARTTHQGLIPGVETSGWLIDAQYEPTWLPSTLFRGWYGRLTDDFRFVDAGGIQTVRAVNNATIARGDSEVQAFGIEGTAYLIPNTFYVAGRYSLVSNESDGVSNPGDLDRIQLGVGWWLHRSTLVKAEYVRQTEELNSPGQIGSDWDGYALELSTKF